MAPVCIGEHAHIHYIPACSTDYRIEFCLLLQFSDQVMSLNVAKHKLPLFVETECDDLTDPVDGTVTITPNPNEIGVGSEATYGCNDGFELQGNTTRTCQEDGQWTNMAPVCIGEHISITCLHACNTD